MTPELTVYGKPGCGYCDRVKNDLTSNGVKFEYIDIAATPSAFDHLLSIMPVHAKKTLPQVFLTDGTYVGGSDETRSWLISRQTEEDIWA